jgi:hypothetical protein
MYILLLTLMLVPQSGGVAGTIHTEKMLFPTEGNGHQNCIDTGQEWVRSFSNLTSKNDGATRIEAHAVCLANAVNAVK